MGRPRQRHGLRHGGSDPNRRRRASRTGTSSTTTARSRLRSAALSQLVGLSASGRPRSLSGSRSPQAILAATYILARIVHRSPSAPLSRPRSPLPSRSSRTTSATSCRTRRRDARTLCVLVLLIASGASVPTTAGRSGSSRLAAAIGLAALTKPEPAAAALLRGRGLARRCAPQRRSSPRRESRFSPRRRSLIPGVVYGVLADVRLGRTQPPVREPLPASTSSRPGQRQLLRVRMPLTLESFVELGGESLLYGVGAALMLVAAHCAAARRTRTRRAALGAARDRRLGGDRRGACEPEALRHGLEFIYGWIPAGEPHRPRRPCLCALRRNGSSAAREREIVALTGPGRASRSRHATARSTSTRPHPQMAVVRRPARGDLPRRVLHLSELAARRQACSSAPRGSASSPSPESG